METDASILLGTGKGAFVLTLQDMGSDWHISGPLAEVSPINHMIADPKTGHLHAAGGGWFGYGVWRSTDAEESWTLNNAGLALPDDQGPITGVWSLARSGSRLYAGTKPAALFVSEDDGLTWAPVAGLNDHPTRPDWNPGGAGLTLHHIVTDPTDPDRLWVGISAAGVFATDDGGASWAPRNAGTRLDIPGEETIYPEFGQCVHSLVRAGGAGDLLYQQNHCGMYRSTSGGQQWESIENGLPTSFGFPIAVHPQDPQTLWLFPLNGDVQGRFAPDAQPAVWRSHDGGESWTALRNGLPQSHAYFTVLRQAMAVDPIDASLLVFGTNAGEVWASADQGDSFVCIARHLPPVLSVEFAGPAPTAP